MKVQRISNSPYLPWAGIQFCSYGPGSAIAGDQEPVELCLVQVAITCPVLSLVARRPSAEPAENSLNRRCRS